MIEIYDSNLTKENINTSQVRTACRGIVLKDGKYLVVRLSKWDITTFPGGGVEEGESFEDCVIREILEETGIEVTVEKHTISIKEYFIDSTWENHYFICRYVKDTNINKLTDEEQELGLVVEWKTLDTLLDIFENNPTKHEHGGNIHNREFMGLIHSL